MLTQSAMIVVFVLGETITLGREYSLTAMKFPKACYGKSNCNVPQERIFFERKR